MAACPKAPSFQRATVKPGGLVVLAAFLPLLLLLLLPETFAPPAARAANPPAAGLPQLRVKAGFDSYYKLNSWLPIRVDITLGAGASGFSGGLEASFTNFGEGTPVYRREVQLSPPADREVWLYLPTGNRGLQEVQLRLVGQDGAVVTSQALPIQPLDQSDLAVGVISADPNALATLNGQRLTLAYNKGSLFYATNYYSRSPAPGIVPAIKIIHILPQDLPPEASGWDSLDGLALTGLSNTIPLDRLQNAADMQSAAAAWLVQGRFLFISGDSGLTGGGFLAGFLPVKGAGVPRTGPLPDYLSHIQTEAGPSSQYLAAAATLLPGARAQLSLDGQPFLVEKPFGLGRSFFSAAELTALPPSVLAGLWQVAFQDYEPHLSYTTGLRRPAEVFPPWTGQLSPNTRAATLPDIEVIALALGIYILLVGPASYLVLKKMGKRELGWLAAPVLALIFSVGFYGAGAVTSGEPLVISRFSVVMLGETAEGKLAGGATGLGTLYSNARQSVDLQVAEGAQAISLPASPNTFDPGVSTPNAGFTAIREGPGGGFGPVYLGQDDQRSFALESATPPEVGEGIIAKLSAQRSEISGTLENRSGIDWTNLSIWTSGNQIYRVPLLKAGEKITLQKTNAIENRTDSLVLMLAGLVDGNGGTSNSVLAFGSPVYQSQEVTVLNTLLGSEGQALPKGVTRVYLVAWSQATYSFPLKIGNQATGSKDLTLLFEPLTLY